MGKEQMEEKRKLVTVLTVHPQLGTRLIPYFVKKLSTEEYIIEEQALQPNNLQSPIENELISFASGYSEKSLMEMYSRDKYTNDFLRNLKPDLLHKMIRPFIDKTIWKILELILTNNFPLFTREKGDKRLYKFNRIETTGHAATASVQFILDKGFCYSIQCYRDGEKLDLMKEKPVVELTKSPASFILGHRLYTFANIKAPMIMPFFNRNSVSFTYDQLDKYLKVIIFPSIRNYPTRFKGFPIRYINYPLHTDLNIENGIVDQTIISLIFYYGEQAITQLKPALAYPQINYDEQGLPTIKYFTRNFTAEQQKMDLLTNWGLKKIDDMNFMLSHENVMEWIVSHKSRLEKEFRLIREDSGKELYLGKISLKQDIEEKTDWFDINIIIKIGEYTFPFIRFRDCILQKDRTFELPNGKVALLPEEWFIKYNNFFSVAKKDKKDHIRLKKIYVGIISNLENKKKGKYIEKKQLPVPAKINATLRSYQIEGYSWMAHLVSNGLGGCLADDMGLGKTLQIITLLQQEYSSEKKMPSLIVVPTSLIDNWLKEISKFSMLKAYEFRGSAKLTNELLFRIFGHFDIIITSYTLLWRYAGLLTGIQFLYVILDESQAIKNPTSSTYQAAINLKSKYRFVLTGTPIENSLRDLWAQFNFINPGLLGSSTSFQKNFILPIVKAGDTNVRDNLKQLITPFLLRRTKKQVAPELPSMTEEIIYCDMVAEQKELYLKEKNTLRNLILSKAEEGISNFVLLSGISQLRQLANHPYMVDLNYEGTSGKMERVLEDFETLQSEGHKVLIFSSFVKHLEILGNEFAKRDWKYALLTGGTHNREKEIESFTSQTDIQAFFISLKAGGTGLNLTQADYVFILDPWWNPAAEKQALSRAHRIGQNKNVFVYRYITKGSIEEKIKLLQRKKNNLAQDFITINDPLKSMSDEDWRELIL